MKVLVINVPALHLGYLGCYGNEWIDTPHLDRLAAEGVVFDQHLADSLGAEDENRTAWTGRYHFPFPGSDPGKKREDFVSLRPLLEAAGIAFSLANTQNVARSEITPLEDTLSNILEALDRHGSQDNWLVWTDWPSLEPPWNVPDDCLPPYFPEPSEEGEEPLLPWLEPPSGPLDLSEEDGLERLQNTYAALVTCVDTQLGLLLEELEQREWLEETLFCVTSPRGLALGEHGLIGDWRPWLHDELIHLPLVVRLPQTAEAGRRVGAITQPVDLLPTILEAFGIPVPDCIQGRSLWPLLTGEVERVRDYACTGWERGSCIEWALRTPEWGYLLPVFPEMDQGRGPQLYVKPDDRWEVNNVLQHHQELGDSLEKTLRAFVAASSEPKGD